MAGLVLDVKQQGNLMKVKVNQKLSGIPIRAGGNGGRRGRISGFSSASRKRLLEVFAGLDNQEIKERGVAFLTLTYGQEWPDPDKAKRHLKNFLERIQRRDECEDIACVWKMEPQERGAPHFHVVLFGWKRTPMGWPITKDDFARIWGETIGDEYLDYSQYRKSGDLSDVRAPFTRIECIRSFRRLIYYVSKYMAKETDLSDASSSPDEKSLDRNGSGEGSAVQVGGVDADPRASADGADSPACDTGFINVAYLSMDGSKVEYMGRSWGIMFRSALPHSKTETIQIECNDRFEAFIAHLSIKWARISKDTKGFTLFSEYAADWYDTLLLYWGHVEGVPF